MPLVSAYRPGVRNKAKAVASGAVAAGLLAAVSLAGGSGTAQAASDGLLRINQVGYADGGAKEAFLLTRSAVSGAEWRLVDGRGKAVASGRTGAGLGGRT